MEKRIKATDICTPVVTGKRQKGATYGRQNLVVTQGVRLEGQLPNWLKKVTNMDNAYERDNI